MKSGSFRPRSSHATHPGWTRPDTAVDSLRCAPRNGRGHGGELPLTPAQEQILSIFTKTPVAKAFYFGGATALSAVHLQHRLSEDLDFFRATEFTARLLAPFERALAREGFTLQRERRLPVYVYEVTGPDGASTRVDFAYYPYDRIERGLRWRGVEVDSLYDLAVNKLQAVVTRFEDKDLVDLYFLLTLRPELDLERLVLHVGLKFEVRIDPLTLAEKLMRASEIRLMPKLLRPASKTGIATFLAEQARRLANRHAR